MARAEGVPVGLRNQVRVCGDVGVGVGVVWV